MSFYTSDYGNIILSEEDFKKILDLTRMNVRKYQDDLLRVTDAVWERYENQSGQPKKSISDIIDDYMEEQDRALTKWFPWDIEDFEAHIFWSMSRANVRKKTGDNVKPIAEDLF